MSQGRGFEHRSAWGFEHANNWEQNTIKPVVTYDPLFLRTPLVPSRLLVGNQTYLEKDVPMGMFNWPHSCHHLRNTCTSNIQTHVVDLARGSWFVSSIEISTLPKAVNVSRFQYLSSIVSLLAGACARLCRLASVWALLAETLPAEIFQELLSMFMSSIWIIV